MIKAESGDFLTNYEYATMLYFEPRGISCAKCHGENGRRIDNIRYIKHYPEKKQTPIRKIVKIKPIYDLNLTQFDKAVKSNKKKFMPTYKLSSFEIKLIHFYLQKSNGLLKSSKKTNQHKKNAKTTK